MIKPLFHLALFAIAAFAQQAGILSPFAMIGFPPEGANVTAGDTLVVQVQAPYSQEVSHEIGVVIGFRSMKCSGANCNTSNGIGDILYSGAFNPRSQEQHLPRYENFTVQVPSSMAKGNATISVVHCTIATDPSSGTNFSYTESLSQNVTVV